MMNENLCTSYNISKKTTVTPTRGVSSFQEVPDQLFLLPLLLSAHIYNVRTGCLLTKPSPSYRRGFITPGLFRVLCEALPGPVETPGSNQ